LRQASQLLVRQNTLTFFTDFNVDQKEALMKMVRNEVIGELHRLFPGVVEQGADIKSKLETQLRLLVNRIFIKATTEVTDFEKMLKSLTGAAANEVNNRIFPAFEKLATALKNLNPQYLLYLMELSMPM
jgi:hypothetical protein